MELFMIPTVQSNYWLMEEQGQLAGVLPLDMAMMTYHLA